ncbi:MAG: histidinol-phosphatase [Clostridia bacterium]|nr:histidinol-phosphatase [Clostridia bacterium]
MNYNYHTHTARCRHASGTERGYIEKALAAGITKIGFSEHIPLEFADGHDTAHRLPVAEETLYFDTLRALREEYRDRAEILIGYEVEYYPLYFKEQLRRARELGAEYLILGQHYIRNEEFYEVSTYALSDSVEDLICYTDTVIEAMKTGLFTYVAHPDVFSFTGDAAIYDREMRRICETATELNVPLEINFYGIRSGRRYPEERFWKIAGKCGSPVTFGFDAHDEAGAADLASLPRAMELVEKYNLNYIGAPKIIYL